MSNVLKPELAEKRVLDFVPPKIDLATPEQARGYIEAKKAGNPFRMSDVIRIQTGVREIEAADFEQMVEQRTLERLKELQESAYHEAYQLGLEEGKLEAYKKLAVEIEERLGQLDQTLGKIDNLKTELLQFNESHIVQLAFHMATRLAHAEIKANPEVIKEIIKSALEIAQVDETVTVRVCPSQFAFLETLKQQTGREFEFLKKVKLESSEEVSEGGCIIETNYGSIDARFEERVSKLWEALSENLYKVKDRISVA